MKPLDAQEGSKRRKRVSHRQKKQNSIPISKARERRRPHKRPLPGQRPSGQGRRPLGPAHRPQSSLPFLIRADLGTVPSASKQSRPSASPHQHPDYFLSDLKAVQKLLCQQTAAEMSWQTKAPFRSVIPHSQQQPPPLPKTKQELFFFSQFFFIISTEKTGLRNVEPEEQMQHFSSDLSIPQAPPGSLAPSKPCPDLVLFGVSSAAAPRDSEIFSKERKKKS